METLKWFSLMYIKIAHTYMGFFVSFQDQASEAERAFIRSLCFLARKPQQGWLVGSRQFRNEQSQCGFWPQEVGRKYQATQDHLLFPSVPSVLALAPRDLVTGLLPVYSSFCSFPLDLDLEVN